MFHRIRAVTFATLMLATFSPAIINNTAVAQMQPPIKIASTVLATANGLQLTQSMVNSVIKIGEFVADHKFTAAEKQWLTQFQIKNFRKNPAVALQGHKRNGQILSQIRQLRNPVRLAQLRESIMISAHLKFLARNEVNRPSIMTIVYKYSPVLYANPKYKIVITKRSIDSIYSSRNFVAKIAGIPSEQPNFKELTKMFQSSHLKKISSEDINNIMRGESRSVRLQQAWSKVSPQVRERIITYVKQNTQRGETMHSIARGLENSFERGVTKVKFVPNASELLNRQFEMNNLKFGAENLRGIE